MLNLLCAAMEQQEFSAHGLCMVREICIPLMEGPMAHGEPFFAQESKRIRPKWKNAD